MKPNDTAYNNRNSQEEREGASSEWRRQTLCEWQKTENDLEKHYNQLSEEEKSRIDERARGNLHPYYQLRLDKIGEEDNIPPEIETALQVERIKILERLKRNSEKVYTCFVMMPYHDKVADFDRIYNEGVKPVEQIISKHTAHNIEFILAKDRIKSPVLIGSIHENIKAADFCLADITNKNPNVLYEAGYSVALGKDLLVITQDTQQGPYLTDISQWYHIKYKEEDLVGLQHKLAAAVDRAIEACIYKRRGGREAYDITCYSDREHARLQDSFSEAERRIDILETNLYTIEKYYQEVIRKRLENQPGLFLRLLTLDPESYFVAMRAQQLGEDVGDFRDELRASIENVTNDLKGLEKKFALRIYDTFPTQITFIADESIFNCAVAMAYRSRELCTFQLKRFQAGADKSFCFHFNAVWSQSKEYRRTSCTSGKQDKEKNGKAK